MDVREITPADSADLRREVLRGGRDVPLPGDESPAFHVGVYDGHHLVADRQRARGACALAARPAGLAGPRDGHRPVVPRPRRRRPRARRPRRPRVDRAGGVLWCNARTPARAFYERAGLVVRGAEWVDPEIGPHVVMWRRLS